MVTDMLKEISEEVRMEVRPNSKGSEYLEAVVKKSNLELLQSILIRHLGSPGKGPGEEAHFSEEIRGVVDSLGGLRNEQSFFYRQEDNKVAYAVLWPWESDPDRITLKAGESLLNR